MFPTAVEFLRNSPKGKYDAVIVDSSDPVGMLMKYATCLHSHLLVSPFYLFLSLCHAGRGNVRELVSFTICCLCSAYLCMYLFPSHLALETFLDYFSLCTFLVVLWNWNLLSFNWNFQLVYFLEFIWDQNIQVYIEYFLQFSFLDARSCQIVGNLAFHLHFVLSESSLWGVYIVIYCCWVSIVADTET